MKIAIYARVSTPEQTVETQLRALWRFSEARGWDVHREYVDVGVSGSRAAKPEFDLLMKDARALRFKVVLVWKFDRVFRSVQHMLQALQEFRELGIDFVSMTEAIDTTTAAGKMVFTMLAAVAEFEKDLIRERTRAGLARARAAGKRIGRPRRLVDVAQVEELHQDHSFRQISKMLHIPVATLHAALCQPVQKGSGSFPNREGQQRQAKV
jgi:DNA invertase Pin-like site-specific DNA recombinase